MPATALPHLSPIPLELTNLLTLLAMLTCLPPYNPTSVYPPTISSHLFYECNTII